MKVVIIISLYNAELYVKDLFGSLRKYYGDQEWVKVLAIDDCSRDQTLAIAKKWSPWIEVIQTKQNWGFAKANNVATEYALRNYHPEFLFYLNQDTEVEEGFLEKLIAVLKQDPSIGIVQPLLMIYPLEKGIVNCAGCRIHYLGYGYTIDEGVSLSSFLRKQESRNKQQKDLIFFGVSFGLLDSGSKSGMTYHDIPYASGAAFMIRSEIVKQLSLRGIVRYRSEHRSAFTTEYDDIQIFDPYYVSYHEDTDLSLRVKQLGYRVVLYPESRIAHKYTTPEQVKNKKQTTHNAYYWIERNRFVLFAKFYTTRMLMLFLPAFIINEIGVMIFSLLRGFWKERLKMYWWLVTHWSDLTRIRKSSKRDKDWEQKFLSLFSTEIWHGNADNMVLPVANIFWKIYFWFAKEVITLWH